MLFEELGNLLNRTLFVSLDRLGGKPLVKGFYVLGVAATGLWAISHFFLTFSDGFGSGLWGLVEIAIFGLFAITALRMISEALIVYFKAHEDAAAAATTAQIPASLVDELRDVIDQLGNDEDTATEPAPASPPAAAKTTPEKPAAGSATPRKTAAAKATPRTARRTPRKTAAKPASKSDET